MLTAKHFSLSACHSSTCRLNISPRLPVISTLSGSSPRGGWEGAAPSSLLNGVVRLVLRAWYIVAELVPITHGNLRVVGDIAHGVGVVAAGKAR